MKYLNMYFDTFCGIFDFKERATRFEYWNYIIITISFTTLLLTIGLPFEVVGLIEYLLLLPTFALTIRRLRDTNVHGLKFIIYFIPIIGHVLTFIKLFTPSHKSLELQMN